MTYYIGIDQSYRSSGIIITNDQSEIVKQEIVSTLKDYGSYFRRAKIASESIASIVNTLDEYTDEDIHIGIEGLAHGIRSHTLQNLAGLQFMIVNAIEDMGFKVAVYTPSTLKKFATGSGKGSKEDMFTALPGKVQKMFESIPKSHGREDLVDAYWISRKVKDVVNNG